MGAEEKGPEAGGEGYGGERGDRGLRYLTGAEELRDGEGHDAAVESVGEIAEAHEPYGRSSLRHVEEPG